MHSQIRNEITVEIPVEKAETEREVGIEWERERGRQAKWAVTN